MAASWQGCGACARDDVTQCTARAGQGGGSCHYNLSGGLAASAVWLFDTDAAFKAGSAPASDLARDLYSKVPHCRWDQAAHDLLLHKLAM